MPQKRGLELEVDAAVPAYEAPARRRTRGAAPDGSWRICYDYRGLNAASKRPDVEPLPHIDALLDGTRGSRLPTNFDLASSYRQLRVLAAESARTGGRRALPVTGGPVRAQRGGVCHACQRPSRR